jgi:hypothetical protein
MKGFNRIKWNMLKELNLGIDDKLRKYRIKLYK